MRVAPPDLLAKRQFREAVPGACSDGPGQHPCVLLGGHGRQHNWTGWGSIRQQCGQWPALHRPSRSERVSGEPSQFTRSGGSTAVGPAEWFTGAVFIDGIRNPDEQSDTGCAHVRFSPGSRTAWHSHPRGQTLYVTDGIGLVSYRGGEVVEIRPGDVVYIEPNEEHWHGATPDRFMAHVAMQEADAEGRVVTWFDHVTDEEYGATL
jgi:quercetin dioxygenase-like cupin family protein